jgi:hypothetical protein
VKFLNKEYKKYLPANEPWKNGLFSAVVILSVFFLFQPFGFRDKDLILKLILFPAYSLIAYLYSVTNFLIVRRILKSKNRWTIKNELLCLAINILTVTLLVHLLSSWITGDMPLNLSWYFKLFYHVSSLFLLIAIIEFLYYSNKSSHSEIELLSSHFQLVSQQLKKIKQGQDAEIVTISLEKDLIDLNRNKIIFIKSIGNYLEFNFRESNGQINKLLKRGRIHQAEKDLEGLPEFLRCHRAFIVNLKLTKQIKGNSKNARLVFDQKLEEIPVSRFHFKALKERLEKIISG